MTPEEAQTQRKIRDDAIIKLNEDLGNYMPSNKYLVDFNRRIKNQDEYYGFGTSATIEATFNTSRIDNHAYLNSLLISNNIPLSSLKTKDNWSEEQVTRFKSELNGFKYLMELKVPKNKNTDFECISINLEVGGKYYSKVADMFRVIKEYVALSEKPVVDSKSEDSGNTITNPLK